MITYAQNFEDVLLERIFRSQPSGFYVDVGAWDPVTDSVTKHFYDRGWSGVNIEPVRAQWHLFQEARPRDINLNVAAGVLMEKKVLFEFPGAGYSTFRSDYRESVATEGNHPLETSVDVLPLAEICQRHVKTNIDFLKIDVEGWEGEVIQGADWIQFRPKVVLVESTWPNSSRDVSSGWEPLLFSAGYVLAYFDGLNRFYVRKEDSSLLEMFRVPVNVFDEVKPYGWVLSEREVVCLKEKLAIAEREREDLLRSKSWRYTAIFRRVKAWYLK